MGEIEGHFVTVFESEKDPIERLLDSKVKDTLCHDMGKFVKEVHDKRVSMLVFLDRSARPASWFFESVWRTFYPQEELPKRKFINIGREKVEDFDYAGRFADREQKEQYTTSLKQDLDSIDQLRRTFTVKNINDEYTDRTYIDGERVWIIDEYVVEGVTLQTAEVLFKEAFHGRYTHTVQGRGVFSIEPPWVMRPEFAGVDDSENIDTSETAVNKFQTKPIRPVTEESLWLRNYFYDLAANMSLPKVTMDKRLKKKKR